MKYAFVVVYGYEKAQETTSIGIKYKKAVQQALIRYLVSDVLKVIDQTELLSLKREQTTIIDSIDQEDTSQGKRVYRLGEILEQRISLGDSECDYPPSQISVQLKKIFEGKPIASFLHRYLPDKWKDPRDMENAKLAEHLTSGRLMVCQRIEDLSNEQLERYFDSRIEYDNLLDDNIRINNKELSICEQVAHERGLELGGYKYRKPISAHDDHYEIPVTLEGLKLAILEEIKKYSEFWYPKFYNSYNEWPAATYEHLKKHYLAIKAMNFVMESETDIKWTGDVGYWADRVSIEAQASDHAAGNSDKLPTHYCTWCSRDIDEDPDEYQLMMFDESSPTAKRCLKCKGTSYVTRFITREQIGDRKEFMAQQFKSMLSDIQGWPDLSNHVRRHYWDPTIAGRKARIGPQFSNSAIAGTDTKVLKNKAK